ncbi:MAG: hypothetical protein OEO79_08775 [Gemmatimonadota bacterium]|nr:hypothetical protein [Gemmatimonadota bacterium]
MTDRSIGTARRAFSEFVVIVVGVLVALWIDAAYQAWEDRGHEQQALTALAAELEETLRRLDSAIQVQERTVAAHRELFQLSEAESLPDQDSLGVLVGRAFYFARLEPVRGTYDALIGSGEIRLLRDHQMRDALARLFGTLADGYEDEGMADMGRVELNLAMAEVGPPTTMWGAAVRSVMGLPPAEGPLPYETLLRSPRYLAALGIVAYPEQGVLQGYFRPLRESLVAVLEQMASQRD